ncbi:aminoacyl tRNA synthase complex-interacting multifunctional protein 1-like [Cololabis saira]|uniref:aminoacyl tRNA synthase complex-interacting multifunctional protein 1-like n=1 Tax=Cololabis saira TaxID=129043 RepID=UPI002AD24436|nr:aminoacyl tRNA synthase complex-interacting multifunctional protein 1-like [Cololabis saira]
MDPSGLLPPSLPAAIMKLDPEDGEKILEFFTAHALLTKEKTLLTASIREQKKLLVENGKLKKEIEQLRVELQDKQQRRAAKTSASKAPPPQNVGPAPAAALPPSSLDGRERQSRRRRGERKARPTSDHLSLGAESRCDVSRLDLRVGRILSVRHHPLTEDMSVQEVDVGEDVPRTVVSKLAGGLLDKLPDSLAVLLCNLKASKKKGVVSQARLLCCSAPDDRVEVLAPPTGSAPGDRVSFLTYPGEPDRELRANQRVWERLLPDLTVDGRGVANYKGCGFQVKGKGLCRAPSLTNCCIR